MSTRTEHKSTLPIGGSPAPIYVLSIVIAALMTASSIAGIFFQELTYPSAELVEAFASNDVLMLAIGLPMLLISMWLASRGKLVGLLLWQGALIFTLYNYLVYVLAMPHNAAFMMHLTLTALCAYTLIALIAGIDGAAVRARLAGVVPDRLCGGILAGLGLLFLLRAAAVLIGAVASQTPLGETEVALNSTDFLITPIWLICGLLLWRREPLGYVTGLGVLFQGCMLFIGLIFILIWQPILSAGPFPLVDVVVVFVMGLICFIPFGLFLRGAISSRKT
jgi:hypothetical protein